MSQQGETKPDSEKLEHDGGGDARGDLPFQSSGTAAQLAATATAAAPAQPASPSTTVKPDSTGTTSEQKLEKDVSQTDDKTAAVKQKDTATAASRGPITAEIKTTVEADEAPRPFDKQQEKLASKTESATSKTGETSFPKQTLDPETEPADGGQKNPTMVVASEDTKKNAPDDAMDIDDSVGAGQLTVTNSEVGRTLMPETTKESAEKEGRATPDSSTQTDNQKTESTTSAPSNATTAITRKPDADNTTVATAMEIDFVVNKQDDTGPSGAIEPKAKLQPEVAATEVGDDAFENPQPLSRKRKRHKKIRAIKVNLSTPVTSTPRDTASKSSQSPSSSAEFLSSRLEEKTYTTADRMLAFDEDWVESSLVNEKDEALSFFEETHEEQDPAFDQYLLRKKKDDLKKQLAEVEVRDREGREEIETLINRLSKEKRESTDKSHKIYREKVDQDEKKEMSALRTTFQERSQTEQAKIQKGLKFLQAKQQKEVNMALQHHSQRRLPEQIAQVEWQKTTMALQSKHNMQLQEFRKKSEEISRKTSNEYNVAQEKNSKKYGKKRAEVDGRRDKFVSQQMGQFAQLKQRYLKKLSQKILKDREAITEEMKDDKPEGEGWSSKKSSLEAQEAATEKQEHRPPSPVQFVPDWVRDIDHEIGESVTRQKHRKGVLAQAVRQLSIEIHNEGIWSLLVRKVGDDGKTENVDEEFIQWGPRAFMTIESVVCGEIPSFYENLNFSDAPAVQGGQLRCSITDLRTSDETAALHRSEAFKEKEASKFAELEKTAAELIKLASDAEKAFKKSEQEEKHASSEVEKAASLHDKAKKDLEAFRAKFQSFLGPDGNPLPTTNAKNRQELMQTIMRYNANIQMAGSKAAHAHQNMTEAKNRTQRLHLALKAAQKNAVNSSNLLKQKKASLENTGHLKTRENTFFSAPETRASDAVDSLSLVAAKRRDQLNQKKTSAFTKTWAQSYPELSDSMKKSIWHRMVRRKQQVILRPTQESLVTELLEKVRQNALSNRGSRGPPNHEQVENEMMKAEQTFLLACHPAPDEPLPSVPSQSWAEPGWHIDLRVPESSSSNILPCAPSFPILNKALNDFASAPGRQAASILSPSSFRPLMAPLTSFAQVSSLAEANTSLFPPSKRADNDPFEISDEAMKRGYTFTLKTAPTKTPVPRRKSIPKNDDALDTRTTGSNAKSCDSSLGSASEKAQKRKRTKDPSATSRKKKTPESAPKATNASSSSSPAQSQVNRSRKKQPTSSAPQKQAIAKIQPSQHGAPPPGVSQHGMPQQGLPQQGIPPQGASQRGTQQPGSPTQGASQRGAPQLGVPQQSATQRSPGQLGVPQQGPSQPSPKQGHAQHPLQPTQTTQSKRPQQSQHRQSQQQHMSPKKLESTLQQGQSQQTPTSSPQQIRQQPNKQRRQSQQQQLQPSQQAQHGSTQYGSTQHSSQKPQSQQRQQHTQQRQQLQQQQQQLQQQQIEQMAQFRAMQQYGRQGFPNTMQQMQQFYAPRGPFQPGMSMPGMQRPGMPGMPMFGMMPQNSQPQSPNSGGQNQMHGQHAQPQQQFPNSGGQNQMQGQHTQPQQQFPNSGVQNQMHGPQTQSQQQFPNPGGQNQMPGQHPQQQSPQQRQQPQQKQGGQQGQR